MSTYYGKSNFKVGQEVVVAEKRRFYDSYGSETKTVISDGIVEKIGNKYITVSGARFVIQGDRIFGDANVGGDLHPSIEAYREHAKRVIVTDEIEDLFSYGNGYKLGSISNEQIFAIADILGIEYKGEDENASEKNE